MALTSEQIDALKLDQLRAEIAGLLIPDSKIEMHEVIVGKKLRRDVCWFRIGHGWNPVPDYPRDIAAAWFLVEAGHLVVRPSMLYTRWVVGRLKSIGMNGEVDLIPGTEVTADTAPEAICRSFLKAFFLGGGSNMTHEEIDTLPLLRLRIECARAAGWSGPFFNKPTGPNGESELYGYAPASFPGGESRVPDYPGDIAAAWTLIDRSSLLFDYELRQTIQDGKGDRMIYQFGNVAWDYDGAGKFIVHSEGATPMEAICRGYLKGDYGLRLP